MILLQALVRLVSFLLLVVLALAGLAVAIFSIQPGDAGLSLGQLAQLVRLPELRELVNGWLDRLESDGPTALVAALCGLGAAILGLLLLGGVLLPRRERLVALRSTEHGALGARRRPLAQLARRLAEQGRGVTEARVKVKPRRRGGGRLSVTAFRSRTSEDREVRDVVRRQLGTLTGPFRLRARVQVRAGQAGRRGGARVE